MENKIVWFGKYCHECKYESKKENEKPCDECLEFPANEDSHRPVEFVPKSK